MIIYIRSTDANPDPRMQKYIDFIVDKNIDYKVICWDRDLRFNDSNNYIYFRRFSKYGLGTKNVISLLLFNLFILKILLKNRKIIDIIHACDFDTILPAISFKLIFHKKVIYDIFDWYVDSRNVKNKLLKSIILGFEKFCLKRVDATIICEEERKTQLNFHPKELWILPNIPYFQVMPHQIDAFNNKIIVSYVGVFSKDRGLEKIIRIAKENQNEIELHIAGTGELTSEIEEATKNHSNIKYYGKVLYKEGLKIMYNSDIIFAIYEKTNPNHIYAAPNKYYEGLFLGRPILTTRGTSVGDKTMLKHTGFVIDENYEDMNTFFSAKQLKAELEKAGKNGKVLWDEYYSNYINDFMEKTYFTLIKADIIRS